MNPTPTENKLKLQAGGFAALSEAAKGLTLRFVGTPDMFAALPQDRSGLNPSGPKDLAYIQFTSGSTRFPRGVMITHEAVLANLTAIIEDGLKMKIWEGLFNLHPMSGSILFLPIIFTLDIACNICPMPLSLNIIQV